jgi:hypothetical protein
MRTLINYQGKPMQDNVYDTNFAHLLLGKDLRKLKNNKKVLEAVRDQKSFDKLFGLIFHHERPLVMRAADAVEKITLKHTEYLAPHKDQLLRALKSSDHKELKWHIAQLMPRITLTPPELEDVWHSLTYWARNPNESKIVRVNALQGLFDIAINFPHLKNEFKQTTHEVSHEPIPSLQARIKKLMPKL